MAVDLQGPVQSLSQVPSPTFVPLKDLKTDAEQAFALGRKYQTYTGRVQEAYDAGKFYQFLGQEQRGTVTEPIFVASLLAALEQGYKDGGERGLPTPRIDFVPTLTDPSRSTTQTLMEFITNIYVRGFDVGRSSYVAAGISGAGSNTGGMMSSDGGWAGWLLGTVAIAAVVVVGVVLVRNSREK